MAINLTTLPSNDTDEHCTFTALAGTETVWEIEFSAINGGATQVYIAGTTGFDDYIRLQAEYYDLIRVRLDATNYSFTSDSLTTDDGEFHTYKIVSDGTDISAFVDGSEIGTAITATVPLNGFETFFRNAGSYSACAIGYFKVTENGTLTHHWDASASGGTGSVFTDIVGSNDATLVNFTTDDSQWEGSSPSPTVTLDDSAFEPGEAITGTYANYTSAPTVVTLTDSEDNAISSASEITDLVIDDAAKTYAFTMPDRITTGTGTTLLRGDITVELT